LQVAEAERELKHKLLPRNALFSAYMFDFIASCPREELHQFLIGLYGEHIIPSTFYELKKVLRAPELNLGESKYLITDEMLANVWARIRDRLAFLDSSYSMVTLTKEYAAHFYDMYINQHEGKHLTGDRIKHLLLNLPFLLRDIIAPEVNIHFCSI